MIIPVVRKLTNAIIIRRKVVYTAENVKNVSTSTMRAWRMQGRKFFSPRSGTRFCSHIIRTVLVRLKSFFTIPRPRHSRATPDLKRAFNANTSAQSRLTTQLNARALEFASMYFFQRTLKKKRKEKTYRRFFVYSAHWARFRGNLHLIRAVTHTGTRVMHAAPRANASGQP